MGSGTARRQCAHSGPSRLRQRHQEQTSLAGPGELHSPRPIISCDVSIWLIEGQSAPSIGMRQHEARRNFISAPWGDHRTIPLLTRRRGHTATPSVRPRLLGVVASPAVNSGRQSFNLTHVGAWSLAPSRPRTSRSTPASVRRFASFGLNIRWSRRRPAFLGQRFRM